MHQVKSVCRICTGACGLILSMEEGRVTSVKGDPDHPITRGYACAKGLQAPAMLQGDQRIRTALRRRPDGQFDPLPVEQALDEISQRLEDLIQRRGRKSIGFYRGTGANLHGTATQMRNALIKALGTENYYTSYTIDQSCHSVTAGRMGAWDAGKHGLQGADVALVVGSNPLVSLGAYGLLSYDPQKRLKEARAQGTKLIVIDPRRTETANQADLFLQPLPGEDATILAGIIREIIVHGWHDRAFCDQWVEGLEALSAAVEPFTLDRVGARADVPVALLEQAARMFAHEARRGPAILGTGVSMAPRSNLTSHMIETLNVLCGRLLQAGELVNPGVLTPSHVFRAEAIAPNRSWERQTPMVTGHRGLSGERLTALLTEQILQDGDEQVRALFVAGGNLAVAGPNQQRFLKALGDLELLVTNEHFMTATAALSHYILPVTAGFERPDVPFPPPYERLGERCFAQYVRPVFDLPDDTDIVDDWYVYWSLAKRLGLTLEIGGKAVNMTSPPSTDEVLDMAFQGGRRTVDDLRAAPDGILLDDLVPVEPARPDCVARLQVAPFDVVEDLAEVAAPPAKTVSDFTHRLIVRRMRDVMNSLAIGWTSRHKQNDNNPAYMHPDDLAELGLTDGAQVDLVSDTGRLSATVMGDRTLRPGLVSMAHCWGGASDDNQLGPAFGANTNQLVRNDWMMEKINAMPTMSAIPVNIQPHRGDAH